MTDIEKAMIILSEIALKNHVTEDMGRTATMYIENYQQEKRIMYIKSLLDRISFLELKVKELGENPVEPSH